MSNQEITPVVFPSSPSIYQQEKEDSKEFYSLKCDNSYHPLGEVIEDDLEDYLDMIIEHFFRLTEMLDDYQNGTFGMLYKTMIDHFSREIGILCHFLKQKIDIKVYKANKGWHEQMIVGVSVKPIDKTE